MDLTPQIIRVEVHDIFLKRFPLCHDLSGRIQNHTGAIEYQAVVAPNLVHHDHRHLVMLGDGGQHPSPKLALPNPEGRCRNVEDEISTRPDQFLNRIEGVEPLVPEVLVVPGIFADGERHLLAAK